MTPEYVDYGSLMTPPAPFRSLNTDLYGFWFEADRERLDALCRKVFAEPSGGAVDYRPIGEHVMLTWGLIGQVVPETPPYDRMGSVQEPQVAIWVPVAQVRRKAGVLFAERFAMFVPYIWLDNAMSLATGRELFGYPKSWGWPTFPAEGEPPGWQLDVFGLDYTGGESAERRPLLEVVEGEAPADAPDREWHGLADMARHIADELFELREGVHVLPGFDFAEALVEDIRGHEFPGVFLKQFRSVEDGTAAALQQIVETRYKVTRLHASPRLREHTLTVHPLDSHPVIEELGLESQTTRLAYRVEMDFLVGGGRVVWDAAEGGR